MPRTINDIIPPSRRRVSDAPTPQYEPAPPPESRPPLYARLPRHQFPWITAGVCLFLVLASYGVLMFFSSNEVEIVPKVSTGTVAGPFIATPASGDLPFALVTVQKVASQSVPAESTVAANDTAQGTVTMYNEQAKSQDLIKNTRLQTSAGLIFRIHDSVTIPPAKGGTPGSVTATVYADSAGESYNIGATSFTLPGLSATPQAKLVYAKSTSAMAGGFTGKRPSVSQATDDAAHAKLKATLAGTISAEISPKVPDGYVLIPGSVVTAYAPLPDSADANGGVLIKEQATATAVVFPASAFAKAIASQVAGQDYTGQLVTLKAVSGLALTPAVAETAPAANTPYSFTLSGTASVVWDIDKARIAGAVAGKSSAAAKSVLSDGFPEIGQAIINLRPFWRGAYPADPTKITVTVDTP